MGRGSEVANDRQPGLARPTGEVLAFQPALAEHPVVLTVEDVRWMMERPDRAHPRDRAAGSPPCFSLRQAPDRVPYPQLSSGCHAGDVSRIREIRPDAHSGPDVRDADD